MQFTGNLQEALKSSERAVGLDKLSNSGTTSNPDFYLTGVQILYALGRWSDAIALARLGIARLPDGPIELPVRLELTRALVANRQLAEALTEVNVVLAIQPNNAEAQQLRTQILAAQGN
jgi:tetratricopeptide (TPR) repeat protein